MKPNYFIEWTADFDWTIYKSNQTFPYGHTPKLRDGPFTSLEIAKEEMAQVLNDFKNQLDQEFERLKNFTEKDVE